jgi:NADH:ubiquinone oxidoreductase subunit E
MKKMKLEICCGTTCFMLGSNDLLNIENEMPSELRGKVEVSAVPCMNLCSESKLSGAPYVRLNGIVIEQATQDKIFAKMRELIEEYND